MWFRVNDLLPDDLQKSLPDRPPEMMHQPGTDVHEGKEVILAYVVFMHWN